MDFRLKDSVECSEDVEKKFELAEEEFYKASNWNNMEGINFKRMYYNREEEYLIMHFHDGAMNVHTPVTLEMYVELLVSGFPEEYYFTEFCGKTFHREISTHYFNEERVNKILNDTKGVRTAEEFIEIIARENYGYYEIYGCCVTRFETDIEMKYRSSYVLYDMKTKDCEKLTIAKGMVDKGFTLLPDDYPLIKEIQSKELGDIIAGRYVLIKGM